MKLSRALSEGLYGKLEYDFACSRGHGFSETYMHGVILEIAAAHVNPKLLSIEPNHIVEEIQDPAKATGSFRKVDLAIVERASKELKVCIEAKWAASPHASSNNVLVDLCRLALISAGHPKAECFFVLAGPKDNTLNLQRKPLFDPRVASHTLHQLLRFDGIESSFTILNSGNANSDLSNKERIALNQKMSVLPRRISALPVGQNYPAMPNWRVHVWRIRH